MAKNPIFQTPLMMARNTCLTRSTTHFQEAQRNVVKSVSKSKFSLQLISCKLQLLVRKLTNKKTKIVKNSKTRHLKRTRAEATENWTRYKTTKRDRQRQFKQLSDRSEEIKSTVKDFPSERRKYVGKCNIILIKVMRIEWDERKGTNLSYDTIRQTNSFSAATLLEKPWYKIYIL